MLEYTQNPIFGFTLAIGAYMIALMIKNRFNYTLLNPLLVSSGLIISFLFIFKIPLENFLNGAKFIEMFLGPATAALAISMYRQIDIVKKNLVPIIVGSVVGAAAALFSVIVLCRVFNLSDQLTASILPKSITTSFATELSAQLGGIVPITVAAVCVTGVSGTLLAPLFVKLFRVDNPIAAGLAIGASSHVLGTSKAVELGEVQGAASGIAVGLCGIATVLIAIFL